MRKAALALAAIAAGSFAAEAADLRLKLEAPFNGVVRIQKIEYGLVTSDAFGGLIGDTIRLDEATYRVQLISNDAPVQLSYFDLQVGDSGPSPLALETSLSSTPLNGRQVLAVRGEPRIDRQGSFFRAAVGDAENARPLTLRRTLRATNWSFAPATMNRLKVSVRSIPADAELWIGDAQQPERTDADLSIPGELIRDAGASLLVRKPGYANELVRLEPGRREQSVSVTLSRP